MEPANDWGKNERVSSTNNNVHIVDFVARIQAPRFLHHPCLFHSIRNSIGVADWARSLKLCIYCIHIYIYIPFGFIRGTEFNIVSLFYFTFFFLSCIVSIIVEQTLFGFPTTFACQLENCVFSTVRTSNGTHKNWWSHSQFELKNRSVFVVHYFRCKYHSNTLVEASLSVTVAVEWII